MKRMEELYSFFSLIPLCQRVFAIRSSAHKSQEEDKQDATA